MLDLQSMFDEATDPRTFVKNAEETKAKRAQKLKEHWAVNTKPGTRNGHHHTDEARAKISAAFKGKKRSEEAKAAMRAAHALRAKPVMTPHGLFPSVRAVAEASGQESRTVRFWIRQYPKHYYYVSKGE